MSNALKTTALLAALTGVMLLLGQQLGGTSGMLMMLVVSSLMNLGSWFFSDRIVLATSGAVPVEDPRLAWLVQDVNELSARAGIPAPRVFVVPHEASPNAFATGRDPAHGVVAVTAGLLNNLDRREIRGVLAHEIGHIANRDTLTSAVSATIAGAITFATRMLWFIPLGGRDDEGGNPLAGLAFAILAPLAATVIHLMISRTREYAADRTAAELTGDPEGLASALEGLSRGVMRAPMHEGSQVTHYIVNGFAGGLAGLFSTHPPIEERVARLRAMR
jgi:heat shock protein HtpX